MGQVRSSACIIGFASTKYLKAALEGETRSTRKNKLYIALTLYGTFKAKSLLLDIKLLFGYIGGFIRHKFGGNVSRNEGRFIFLIFWISLSFTKVERKRSNSRLAAYLLGSRNVLIFN